MGIRVPSGGMRGGSSRTKALVGMPGEEMGQGGGKCADAAAAGRSRVTHSTIFEVLVDDRLPHPAVCPPLTSLGDGDNAGNGVPLMEPFH